MDLGRTYCQARKVSCELCPLNGDCSALAEGHPLKYPIDSSPVKTGKSEHDLHLLRVYAIKGNKVLVYQKDKNEWLSGQYEVPTLILHSSDIKLSQYPAYRLKNSG